ncbi:Fgd6 protein [Pelomyxa schiedti]|nr:Fgd6 protein [Pelomyxa schiedti]
MASGVSVTVVQSPTSSGRPPVIPPRQQQNQHAPPGSVPPPPPPGRPSPATPHATPAVVPPPPPRRPPPPPKQLQQQQRAPPPPAVAVASASASASASTSTSSTASGTTVKSNNGAAATANVNRGANTLARVPSPPVCGTSASPTSHCREPNGQLDERLEKIVVDYIVTEREYVKWLEVIVEVFLEPMKALQAFTPEVINNLFANIPQLLQIHRDFIASMETSNTLDAELDTFTQLVSKMDLYIPYASNFQTCTNSMEDLKKLPAFKTFWKRQLENPRCKSLDGLSLFSMPMQRVPRIHRALEEMVRTVDVSHPSYTRMDSILSIIKAVAMQIEEALNARENMDKIRSVQTRMKTQLSGFNLIEPHRKFLREGLLQKVCRKANKPRTFFLFNDLLLYGSFTSGGFLLHRVVPLDTAQVSDVAEAKFPNAFSISSANKSFIVICSSPEEKQQWVTDINDSITQIKTRRTTLSRVQRDASGRLVAVSSNVIDSKPAFVSPVWQPNQQAPSCTICRVDFTVLNRRVCDRKSYLRQLLRPAAPFTLLTPEAKSMRPLLRSQHTTPNTFSPFFIILRPLTPLTVHRNPGYPKALLMGNQPPTTTTTTTNTSTSTDAPYVPNTKVIEKTRNSLRKESELLSWLEQSCLSHASSCSVSAASSSVPPSSSNSEAEPSAPAPAPASDSTNASQKAIKCSCCARTNFICVGRGTPPVRDEVNSMLNGDVVLLMEPSTVPIRCPMAMGIEDALTLAELCRAQSEIQNREALWFGFAPKSDVPSELLRGAHIWKFSPLIRKFAAKIQEDTTVNGVKHSSLQLPRGEKVSLIVANFGSQIRLCVLKCNGTTLLRFCVWPHKVLVVNSVVPQNTDDAVPPGMSFLETSDSSEFVISSSGTLDTSTHTCGISGLVELEIWSAMVVGHTIHMCWTPPDTVGPQSQEVTLSLYLTS